MNHPKLPTGTELLIGVDVDRSTEAVTIHILQPRANNGAVVIYANRHPMKGDSMGRAFTVAQLEDAAATYSIATDPVYNGLLTELGRAKTADEFKSAHQLLSGHIDRIMHRHQRNIATLMNVNTHLAESLASAPTPPLRELVPQDPAGASQVDPSMALPSKPAREAGQ
jgi:hypothetical protein